MHVLRLGVPSALRAGTALRVGALSAAAAGTIGALVTVSPILAAVGAIGLVGLAVWTRAPTSLLAVALLLLAYTPEYLNANSGVLGRPELQKAALYACLAPLVLLRGTNPRLLLPLVAYLVAAALTALVGDLSPDLSLGQILSTFATLNIGWLALAVNWRWDRDFRYLKAVAFVPAFSVVLGLFLDVAGVHPMFASETTDTVQRLQGASIPAQLALTSFMACVAAYICYRESSWRLAPWLVGVNAAIVVATVSRGAMIALAIVLLVPALRFAFEPLARRPRAAAARIVVLLIIAGGAAAVILPAVAARNDIGYYVPGQGIIRDETSGRGEAWKEFYAIAKESPWFGHGLGSGPITKIQQEGFLAQHNEYLRFFLEDGYIGGGLVLVAIVATCAIAIRRAPPRLRLDLTLTAVAVALFSITDNTLTSVNCMLPFGLLLGICASQARSVPNGERSG
jgi:teichuronic acid biosynthesis protein TuaE